MCDEQARTNKPEDEQAQGQTDFRKNMVRCDKGSVYHCAI